MERVGGAWEVVGGVAALKQADFKGGELVFRGRLGLVDGLVRLLEDGFGRVLSKR